MPSADRIAVKVHESGDGHVALVTVNDRVTTTHRVRISPAERERFGGDDVADLLSLRYERFRSFGMFVEPSGGTAPAPPRPWWRRILRNPLPKDAL